MATTRAGFALTDAHRVAQGRLAAVLVRRLLNVWPTLDIARLDATAPGWVDVITPIVSDAHRRSAALSSAYYDAFRRIEAGLAGAVTVPTVVLNVDALITSLLVTGPYAIKTGTAPSKAAVASAEAAARHGLSGGRDTITTAAAGDPDAYGARRIVSPGCCAFCATLAIRWVDGLSTDATKAGMEPFKVHDNCRCVPEPVFHQGQHLLTAELDQMHAQYREATANGGGLNAFRRSLARA